MGYQTDYHLSIEQRNGLPLPEENARYIISVLRESCKEASYSLKEDGTPSGNESRWYEHKEDLAAFSLHYPDLVFDLYGEGEEAGDLWHLYAWNGKTQEP